MDEGKRSHFDAVAQRDDSIEPPTSFRESAAVSDPTVYERFTETWPNGWRRAAACLEWDRDPQTVLDGEPPAHEWFPDGRLNAAVNCVDRHVETRPNQLAIRWVGRRGEQRSYTYADLSRAVNAAAAGLRELGVDADDVVTLYLPMIPELPVVMLACARLGAVHNVVFAGLSAEALATRLDAADSTFLITCDGYYRRGDAFNQKSRADTARVRSEVDLAATVVVDRLGDALEVSLGPDEVDYGTLCASHEGTTVDPVTRRATDRLFVMYTSGTTGQPTGIEHTTGGYLAHVAWTTRTVLDVNPTDTYFCAADIGWITGHSYGVYGPLAVGTTVLMDEGFSDTPDRIGERIDRHDVTVFYTSPTTIRSLVKRGAAALEEYDCSSIRLLGTVGESITPETWHWYREHVGGGDVPVVDTWWQTETGAILIATLPGVTPMKPGAVGPPLPGIDALVVDEDGDPVDPGESGVLTLTAPWPGMCRRHGMGDDRAREGDDRPRETDWVETDDGWRYRTGDRAVVDEDGYVRILGRVDDVLSVSGTRFSVGALEAAIVGVDGVVEAAAVTDDRGEIVAYVVTGSENRPRADHREAIAAAVETNVVAAAVPDRIVFTADLPKTRSGKIMRRLLGDVARDEALGDVSALRNPEIVGEIASAVREDASTPE
jgi:acetyl-CoA synthetase